VTPGAIKKSQFTGDVVVCGSLACLACDGAYGALQYPPRRDRRGQRRILPYKNADDFERRVEGMRKAGLPV
jgi:hypothetical protein